MDERTVRYYEENAERVFEQHRSARSGVAKYFPLAFPAGSRILDIGAGSGRDLSALVGEAYEAYGVEPAERLREITAIRVPEVSERLFPGMLPGLPEDLPKPFDGVLCSAVFQHIPEAHQFDAAFEIRALLKPDGRLLLSIPTLRQDVGVDQRDAGGRLFVPLAPGAVQLLFERLGFQLISRWEDADSLGRSGHSWTTLLFRLASSLAARPIDQVESVLNRDRKFATYKLALFRALTETALTNYGSASWRGDGRVGVPLRDIAELWIGYYWPLLDSEAFIPQMRGEASGSGQHLAFRPPLAELIAMYRRSGGLARFSADYRSGTLPTGAEAVKKRLIQSLAATIRDGPVTHAGAMLETGPLFKYDRTQAQITLAAEVWRELCLSGHWILDALILRWAELTAEISRHAIPPSAVIDRLLQVPIPERETGDARRIYAGLPSLQCVWSAAPLSRESFEVDHLLPFSLWRNNDLWNLLPADPRVNSRKRDRLPTSGLLKRRRDAILTYWDALREGMTTRFDHEARRFGHDGGTDFSRVFTSVVEAVEVTALQRGWRQWEP